MVHGTSFWGSSSPGGAPELETDGVTCTLQHTPLQRVRRADTALSVC